MRIDDVLGFTWIGGILLIIAIAVVLHALGKLSDDNAAFAPLVLVWPMITGLLLAIAPFYGLHRLTKVIHQRSKRVAKPLPAPDPYIATAEREVDALLLEARRSAPLSVRADNHLNEEVK